MPDAIYKAEMGTRIAERSGISVPFCMGTKGKMRKPFLDPEEQDCVVPRAVTLTRT